MTGIWWTSASIEIFLCSLTATTAHLLMSLGQTLFHRYLGHRGIGGRFFENHLYIHHGHYSGDHVVSEHYLNEEANNTPFFLIPVIFVISLGYLALPLDLFIVQLIAMSISFFVHLYFDKHYHVTGSWLGRFAWFRRKQQLHFLHHRYADCNFAVVDNFWDWLLGSYRGIDADREARPVLLTEPEIATGRIAANRTRLFCGLLDRRCGAATAGGQIEQIGGQLIEVREDFGRVDDVSVA